MLYHVALAMGAIALVLGLWVGMDALAAHLRRRGVFSAACDEPVPTCSHCGQRDDCVAGSLRH